MACLEVEKSLSSPVLGAGPRKSVVNSEFITQGVTANLLFSASVANEMSGV
jgi:hypothetical protein